MLGGTYDYEGIRETPGSSATLFYPMVLDNDELVKVNLVMSSIEVQARKPTVYEKLIYPSVLPCALAPTDTWDEWPPPTFRPEQSV